METIESIFNIISCVCFVLILIFLLYTLPSYLYYLKSTRLKQFKVAEIDGKLYDIKSAEFSGNDYMCIEYYPQPTPTDTPFAWTTYEPVKIFINSNNVKLYNNVPHDTLKNGQSIFLKGKDEKETKQD